MKFIKKCIFVSAVGMLLIVIGSRDKGIFRSHKPDKETVEQVKSNARETLRTADELTGLATETLEKSLSEALATAELPETPDEVLSRVHAENSPLSEINGSGAYSEVNGNAPYFTEEDLTTEVFESYSPLDSLGRCGVAYANICKELMPTEERGEIGMIKPSGWKTAKYPGCVEGNYLYNRCHLIGYQLAGENANEQNLITGTRYLNVIGMLPFEDMVADYIYRNPDNHVLYRVTPVYEGDNLVASGVQMEAFSVEDNGSGVCFCIYCPNIQPGIIIDYGTGESSLDPDFTGEYVTTSVFTQ